MNAPALDASTDEVVAWLLGERSLDCLDEDGRPLGEQGSTLYERAVRDEKHRRFGDARDASGLPYNTAALAQIVRAWPVVLAAIRSCASEREPSAHRAWYRTQAACTYAKLLALRAPDRAVSREAAALYKIALGFGEVLSTLLLEEAIDADHALADERALLAVLDERPFLIVARQVCAGRRAQIREVWRALASDGEGTAEIDWTWATPAMDAAIELSALAAAAAGAAKALLLAGSPSRADAACARLAIAESVPRLCEVLRLTRGASAAHASLLFPSDAVPPSLRAFLVALDDVRGEPLLAIDALLETHARPAAARMMSALGRSAGELGVNAFRTACR